MYFYPDQVDDGGLETLCLILLTLNLGRTMDFLDEEKQKLSERALFVQKIYERKCLHPSKNDILNCIFELQSKGLMSLILQYRNEEDTTFGNQIRARFKHDFLEAAQIEALWKNETLEIILEKRNDSAALESVPGILCVEVM